ncbi:MAG: LacI family DNA-binding transcriptional regulator, partial [Ktedonobacteraceae bacterium]|nr:LacI family DNA-binding transcriptional regulator [Ktedonobacteraceae bacterium]
LTIQDIARLAGVSKATVSRVLNHKPTVDPEIRARVMKVVNERGFVPSITATVLRGGRPPLIGVLAPPLTQPFVPEIMLGVAEVTDRIDYEVVLYTMGPARSHSEVLDRILAMKLSTGLLAIMPGQLGSHLDFLYKQGVPIVSIEDQVAPTNTPWIGIDNVSSAYEATRYLLGFGHRRIGHISGPAEFLCSSERYEGFCRALREAGLEPNPALVWQGDFSTSTGRACAHRIFSLPPEERPTAIFAANDQTAFGLIDVASQYGVRIPDDMAVIGFDDMLMAAYARPGLTTIRQPHHEMGAIACELLLSLINPQSYPFRLDNMTFSRIEQGGGKHIRVVLPTKLIVRESCGVAPSVSHQIL